MEYNLLKSIIISLLIFLSLFNLITNETQENKCETNLDVNDISECIGKPVSSKDNYCCFYHYSYLGPEAKYCMEFPKKDIDNNKIKETINLIELGQYWESRIQTYDVISIVCESSFIINKYFLYFLIYILFI
jgi:hypothetical protein